MPIRVYLRDSPQRAIALATEDHVLIFRHNPSPVNPKQLGSTTSLTDGAAPKCVVEFSPWDDRLMQDYHTLSTLQVQGTLGLVTLNNDVFLCVVSNAQRVATVRPGETIQRISSVEFHCLSSADYDHILHEQVNPFPSRDLDEDGWDHGGHKEPLIEHPCMALKKLLSGGTFYYSADFDLTKRLQDRSTDTSTVAIDSLDGGFLWNTYMIQPLVDFRSRLSPLARQELDQSRILTSAIRGFAHTVTVPAVSSPVRFTTSGMPSTMTLISRLSCRRAGTRFNSRGIDDDGNVANFVETETIFCSDTLCFSYVQCRGSVPIFWEQSAGLPGQQKIQVTRSIEATQPAFDKHVQMLNEEYGDVCVVNLLSQEKPSELQLTRQYEHHIDYSTLNQKTEKSIPTSRHDQRPLQHINYDFHAETRGPNGYEAASGIRRYILDAARVFEYHLTEDVDGIAHADSQANSIVGQNEVLKQAGIFRTNCLDCLDRTNLVQTIISQIAFELFLDRQGEQRPTSDFWARHGMLWADCGDALSKIYAGTGALKSSFTRSGKMSFAGAMADLRKSAQRLYINNFEDKGRQNTIDMLLGRLKGQVPVVLSDPINDWVTLELNKRSREYTSVDSIRIFVGTFNLNGKTAGLENDLRPWLCPNVSEIHDVPEIVAIAFQEIVELDVQQIMSTDPHRRQAWENVVRRTLNASAQKHGGEEYVLLRGGQLVGASLSVFVKASALPFVKNVEGAVKKTGMSGMAGNKGAVAIRFEYAGTSICLVTAHLAAGFANYQERNQDYKTIAQGLHFQRNRTIDDHDSILWFGDFNYRIGLGNDEARALIRQGDLGELYANDQLNIQMVHGYCFPHFSERAPTFLPTYKYDIGTDDFDTSEKNRIPAWCDRILIRGRNLHQLHYNSAPLRFSDHRPVWGLFQCDVNVIDAAKKDAIARELYLRRRDLVGNHTAGGLVETDDDQESLDGYESIEPGLPPASSDKRKWWLDNGMPARATVRPPGPDYVPNPSRPANPFTPTVSSDWIKVERPPGGAGSVGGGDGLTRDRSASLLTVSSAAGDPSKPPGPLPPPRRTQQKQAPLQQPPPQRAQGQSTTPTSLLDDPVPLPPPRPRNSATAPIDPSSPAAAAVPGSRPVYLKPTLRKAVPGPPSTATTAPSSQPRAVPPAPSQSHSHSQSPPPKPAKPAPLRSEAARGSGSSAAPSTRFGLPVVAPTPTSTSTTTTTGGAGPPALPARHPSGAVVGKDGSGTGNAVKTGPVKALLDDDDDDGVDGAGAHGKELNGWVPLKPQ